MNIATLKAELLKRLEDGSLSVYKIEECSELCRALVFAPGHDPHEAPPLRVGAFFLSSVLNEIGIKYDDPHGLLASWSDELDALLVPPLRHFVEGLGEVDTVEEFARANTLLSALASASP
jgi:hypothetical protein